MFADWVNEVNKNKPEAKGKRKKKHATFMLFMFEFRANVDTSNELAYFS